MDGEWLLRFLGYTFEHGSFREFLLKEGVPGEPSSEEMDETLSSNVSVEEQGIDLVFEYPEQVEEATGVRPKSPGRFVFSHCYFFLRGIDGFQPFRGRLPYGVSPDDDASSLKAKFGPSSYVTSEEDGVVYSEAWDLNDIRMFADYGARGQSLRAISFGIPYKNILGRR